MHYIIQEDIFKENHYRLLLETVERFCLSYDVVRVFPFVDKFVNVKNIPQSFDVDELPEYNTNEENVFAFGAVKLARLAKKENWKPGSLLNDNHDYNVYKNFYKENLLNFDSKVIYFSDAFNWKKEERKFIRPCKDSKVFTGKTFTEEEWIEFVKFALTSRHNSSLDDKTKIQVCSVKPIQKEIRFWCVDGKIITGSQYRFGDKTIYSKDFDEEAMLFAQKMVDMYQVADAFVIDVCLTENRWKIVELNCINCAGFYLCDLSKLIGAIEEKFSY